MGKDGPGGSDKEAGGLALNSKYIRSYGRRKGRGMNLAEAEEISAGDDEFILCVDEDSKQLDFSQYFTPQTRKIFFEIGSGGGENLVHQAELYPDILIVGCEPYFNGVATTIKNLKQKGLENARLYAGDARFLMEKIPEHSIDKAFVLYPDPWPKKRHNKRRIINAETLAMLKRILKPGAILRVATDHPDYAEWILLRIFENQGFKWLAESSRDFNNPPLDWLPTKYELKGLAGKPIYFEFERL